MQANLTAEEDTRGSGKAFQEEEPRDNMRLEDRKRTEKKTGKTLSEQSIREDGENGNPPDPEKYGNDGEKRCGRKAVLMERERDGHFLEGRNLYFLQHVMFGERRKMQGRGGKSRYARGHRNSQGINTLERKSSKLSSDWKQWRSRGT